MKNDVVGYNNVGDFEEIGGNAEYLEDGEEDLELDLEKVVLIKGDSECVSFSLYFFWFEPYFEFFLQHYLFFWFEPYFVFFLQHFLLSYIIKII